MASILYREQDGEIQEIYVEIDQLEAHLSSGWSAEVPGTDSGEEEVEEQVEQVVDEENHESETDTETETEEPIPEMSADEVRALAKESGIDGWDTKRIATLRKALESK